MQFSTAQRQHCRAENAVVSVLRSDKQPKQSGPGAARRVLLSAVWVPTQPVTTSGLHHTLCGQTAGFSLQEVQTAKLWSPSPIAVEASLNST